MAKSHPIRSESLDELLNCQVCFEDYQETGDHVPRILPCHHTLCHSCIERLIHRNRVQCPECRSKYDAKKGELNFPQNKYILILVKKKSAVLNEEATHSKKCAEHNKDEMFFCKEKSGLIAICPSCLSAKHLGHQVVEIQDTKQEILEVVLKKVENVSQMLDQKIKKVTETQKDTIKKAQNNIDKLKKKNEEVMETFYQMIKEAEDQMLEMKKATNGEINAMKEKLDLLNNVKQTIETENESTYEDTLEKLDTIAEIEEKIGNIFSGMKTYNYSEYYEAQKFYVGHIVKKEITVDLSTQVQGTKNQLSIISILGPISFIMLFSGGGGMAK